MFLMNSTTASAQTLCGERANFLKHLGTNHQEAPTSMGLTSTGKVIEVLTSEKGTWTIIITDPDGNSCLVAAGEAWEAIKRVALKPAA
jgi:hypothetical protein